MKASKIENQNNSTAFDLKFYEMPITTRIKICLFYIADIHLMVNAFKSAADERNISYNFVIFYAISSL